MGQKTNPIGLRLGINRTWDSRWFTTKSYAAWLIEDIKIRKYIKKRLYKAGVAKIEIERSSGKATVNIYTARPGMVIGRKGSEVDMLRDELKHLASKDIQINIKDVKKPELNAQLVAEHIAMQLEQRVSFRRAMKKTLASAMRMGAQGIKVKTSGRSGRRRDVADRGVPRGPSSAPHAPRGHRLRDGHGAHDLRLRGREGVDLQGRALPQGIQEDVGESRRGV